MSMLIFIDAYYASLALLMGFPGGTSIKNPHANTGDGVPSLVLEDPEEEKGNLSSILALKFPWTEESDWLQSKGSQRIIQDSAHAQDNLIMEVLTSSHCITCPVLFHD